MSENKKLVKAGLTYTIANVVLRGISFFTIPLFIRLLTTEDFGRYNVFISFEGVLFMFSGLTMHASIKNAKYDQKDDYDGYVKNCIYLDFFNSLLIAAIANILCLFWSETIDLNFFEVNLLTISGFCGAVTSIYSSKLIMEYKAGDFAFVSFLSAILNILFSLALIFTLFNWNHYYGRILGVVCGQVVAAIYVLWRIFRTGFSPINTNQWKYGLKISLPIIPHGVSQLILSSANRIMIKYIYGAAKAGIFSFTYTVSLVPQVLFQSVSSVWEPWFFEKMSQGDMAQIRSKSNWFCLMISFVFVLMSFATPEIVRILATAEYEDAIDISIIVLMGCYFATLYNIPCEVEYYHKKTKHIATSTVACAILNIALNFVLMQHFDYKVASYVTLLAYALYFAFHMLMSRYLSGRWCFDVKRMLLIIVVSLVLMTFSLLTIDNLSLRLLMLLGMLAIAATQYKPVLRIVKEIRK